MDSLKAQEVAHRASTQINAQSPRVIGAITIGLVVLCQLALHYSQRTIPGIVGTFVLSIAILCAGYWLIIKQHPCTLLLQKSTKGLWVLVVFFACSLVGDFTEPIRTIAAIIVVLAGVFVGFTCLIPSVKEPTLKDPEASRPEDLIEAVLLTTKSFDRDTACTREGISKFSGLEPSVVDDVVTKNQRFQSRKRSEALRKTQRQQVLIWMPPAQ